ncbi:MAG TPA: DUF1634 domain-containing protein [Cyanobacteria bacterium UBA11372]|nr:DUF1634 domain-containing protein [Cyanobacteria bacterium UBA11372]
MYKLNYNAAWMASALLKIEEIKRSIVRAIAFPLRPDTKDGDPEEFTAQQPAKTAVKLPHNCEFDNNGNLGKTASEQRLELWLSNLLKYGVLIASAIVFIGGILYLMHHSFEPADYHIFHGAPSEFRSVEGVINAIFAGSRRGIIQLGLLVLIATPILRVVISLLAFIWRRDLIYIIVTSLVLAGLTYSLVGGYY